METLTLQSTDILKSRAILYSFISSLFSHPTSERFIELRNEKSKEEILEACTIIDKEYDTNLTKEAVNIFSAIQTSDNQIESEYTRVFGHTLSKKTAPYEMEHLANKEIFYKTQSLADLTGFYNAFGLQVRSQERVDHIAVEAEFMSFLVIKEIVGLEKGIESEKIIITQEAQQKFWADHFSQWVPIFVENLLEETKMNFYSHVGNYVRSFLDMERKYFSKVERANIG